MNILQKFEQAQLAKAAAQKQIPDFKAGDTLRVHVKVIEGERVRTQMFEGVCIGRKNAGINSNVTLRKISFGEGVERVFPLYSPTVEQIEVLRQGVVRRAKLFYLRDRSGKSARIREKLGTMGEELLQQQPATTVGEDGQPQAAAPAMKKAEKRAAKKAAKKATDTKAS